MNADKIRVYIVKTESGTAARQPDSSYLIMGIRLSAAAPRFIILLRKHLPLTLFNKAKVFADFNKTDALQTSNKTDALAGLNKADTLGNYPLLTWKYDRRIRFDFFHSLLRCIGLILDHVRAIFL